MPAGDSAMPPVAVSPSGRHVALVTKGFRLLICRLAGGAVLHDIDLLQQQPTLQVGSLALCHACSLAAQVSAAAQDMLLHLLSSCGMLSSKPCPCLRPLWCHRCTGCGTSACGGTTQAQCCTCAARAALSSGSAGIGCLQTSAGCHAWRPSSCQREQSCMAPASPGPAMPGQSGRAPGCVDAVELCLSYPPLVAFCTTHS